MFGKQLFVSLICIIALAAFTPAMYAVDGCSSSGFKVAANMNLETIPFGITGADLNGDGHLDLIVSLNNSSNEVLVLFGRGGTDRFGPPISVSVGGPSWKTAVGDVNGDGKPDLVVSLNLVTQNGPIKSKLAILLNDGTGKFGAPKLIEVPGETFLPVLGDVNNDGKLDIVTGLSNGGDQGTVAILLGNGAGDFSPAPNSPISTLSNNQSAVVIGDFNEDGKRDLAVPGHSSGVDILLGDGTGRFAAGVNTPANSFASLLTLGDFNNDAHLDVLTGNILLPGTGTGTFGTPITVPIPVGDNAAIARDVNNDGHLDLISAGSGGLTILLGNGTGNLVQVKSYASGFTTFAAAYFFAALGDFNDDGKLDIAAIQSKGVGILDGDGTGAFNDTLSYHAEITPRYVVAADFNNDGKQDFAAASSLGGAPRVEVALGDGTGSFTKKSVTTLLFTPPGGIATADFNGDGKLDLAVTRPNDGKITILLNDGTGGFPTNILSTPDLSITSQPTAIKSGDFNNDGKSDLVVITTFNNSYLVLLGNGSGGFTAFSAGPLLSSTSFADDLDTGDFNGDGKLDFAVVRSGANTVQILQGDGTGLFSTSAVLALPGPPISVVVRDLNGDGKPDIAAASSVVGSPQQSVISVLINNGVSGFNAGVSYSTDGEGIVSVGDFNGDGQPDLVLSSAVSVVGSGLNGIVILTNQGNGTFNAPVYFSAGQVPDYLAVRDFNNDGKDDVLVSEPAGNSVGLLLNNFTTPQPCLSINDVTVTETDGGTVDAVFTVTLSAASAQTVKVNYFPMSALATKGADFENAPGTVMFAPGETTKTITIKVLGDLIDEADQTFFVVLTTPVNAHITDAKGLGTILDNDPPATISINDVAVTEGSSATFTISLNAPSEKTITVGYGRTQNGTATPGTDYFDVGGNLVFQPGTVSQTITVSTVQDNVFEPDETFFINLVSPTNATIADDQGQGTITNDDPQPTISIVSASRLEGGPGTSGNAVFQVNLSNPSYQTITVSYATANGTATAGVDYTATSGTVTFNPGETSKSVNVEVLGDNIDEINETFNVNLGSPVNATIGTSPGVGTILDDDGPTISIANASVAEGNSGTTDLNFTVTLSGPSVQDITVNFATAGGTATANVDFVSVFSRTLFIPAGATAATITIRVIGDLQIEPDEQFTVNLSFAGNATIANAQATGTIINDDSNGKLQFSNPTYSVSETAGNIVIAVNRVNGATGTVTVDYATGNGTAVAGSDYVATSGTLTFLQGETSKTFAVQILNDSVVEDAETINLTLSNPTGGATLGMPTTAVLTISPPLLLILEESGPNPNQVAAVDSLLSLRDPFSIIPITQLLNPGTDRNTRVIVFVANLQLAPGEVASSVRVILTDSNGQNYDVGAEDVRLVPGLNFSQVTFRLPNNLAAGVCNIKIRAHDQESNTGVIRIKN